MILKFIHVGGGSSIWGDRDSCTVHVIRHVLGWYRVKEALLFSRAEDLLHHLDVLSCREWRVEGVLESGCHEWEWRGCLSQAFMDFKTNEQKALPKNQIGFMGSFWFRFLSGRLTTTKRLLVRLVLDTPPCFTHFQECKANPSTCLKVLFMFLINVSN